MNENEMGLQEYEEKAAHVHAEGVDVNKVREVIQEVVGPKPGSLTSEADHLSAAVEAEEAPESAHGPDARRAEEAWDTFPADSSASIDYPLAEAPQLLAPVLEATSYVPEPALNVGVLVHLPNGKTWDLNLEVPDPEQALSNSEMLSETIDHFDAVEKMLREVLPTDAKRAVLGLDES